MPRKPTPPPRIYELKVVLEGISPSIWRTFRIPADASLEDLHLVIQVVMGWQNAHLYEFRHGRHRYTTSSPDGDELLDRDCREAIEFQISDLLTKPKQKLDYIYDFGDDWRHTVTLVAIHEDNGPEVQCVAGERAGPPEDSGGPGGYARLLTILANPRHPEHADMAAWFREMTPPDHDVAVCPIEDINVELEDGMAGVWELFAEECEEDDEEEDGGPDVTDGKIIPFPKR